VVFLLYSSYSTIRETTSSSTKLQSLTARLHWWCVADVNRFSAPVKVLSSLLNKATLEGEEVRRGQGGICESIGRLAVNLLQAVRRLCIQGVELERGCCCWSGELIPGPLAAYGAGHRVWRGGECVVIARSWREATVITKEISADKVRTLNTFCFF